MTAREKAWCKLIRTRPGQFILALESVPKEKQILVM
jgi:hypothetical protein